MHGGRAVCFAPHKTAAPRTVKKKTVTNRGLGKDERREDGDDGEQHRRERGNAVEVDGLGRGDNHHKDKEADEAQRQKKRPHNHLHVVRRLRTNGLLLRANQRGRLAHCCCVTKRV